MTHSSSSKDVDALIIGAGAGGSVAAAALAGAGVTVVCLEQGHWYNAGDSPGQRPEWELLLLKDWHSSPNVRRLEEDYPCELSQSEVTPLMFNAVGGSTIHYAAHWERLLPSDFRVRTLDGIADDWPLTYEELQPYYERVDCEMSVSGLAGDPAYPDGAPPPLPAHPIGAIGRKAAEGMNRLGWHWWPAPNAIASEPHGNLSRCAQWGTCITGCPERAKASMDVTHWPRALRWGARLITGARVREVSVDARGLARGAVWIDRDGREHFQPARVVIVAANGVGTPRLLLLSESKRFPAGLANSSGLVGKRLMVHPHATVTGAYDDDLRSWLGPAGQAIHSLEFYESDPSRGFLRGAKWDVNPTGGPLAILERLSNFDVPGVWGTMFHATIRGWLGHAFFWGINAEDLPDPDNRVTLDGALADSDSIPAPKITYRISENAKAILGYNIGRATEAHEAAGAREVLVHELVAECGWHLLGTARMGDDPEESVVDRWGRTHDVPNLFVVDGSVFVTSGAVNPTATICALSLRCCERLLHERRHQKVPT